MRFEYTMKTKNPKTDKMEVDPDMVPTRVSVGGDREFDVKDRCIDADPRFERALAVHGFSPATRHHINVRDASPEPQPANTASEGSDLPQKRVVRNN